MTVRRMVNPVLPYAWGSRDGIATLQGRPPSTEPEAELWMGAHPQAPSRLARLDATTGADALEPHEPLAPLELLEPLDAVIAADPVGVLGAESVHRVGPRLPFLLKVLSAQQPLSLQVHPDSDQAQRGFAAENAAGVEASQRCYRDPYAKPEMLVALTNFRVLQGFRAAAEAADALAALGIARLSPLVTALRDGTPTGEVFLRLIEWPTDDRATLVNEARVAAGGSALIDDLANDYPNDPGVVGVVLLNDFTLRPSQGLYVRPGQIHVYIHGTGVEIMGGSDNVIRGGLTLKYVSAGDLRDVLDVGAAAPSIIEPAPAPGGGEVWPTTQPEFELSRFRLGPAQALGASGPSVLLCLEGTVDVREDDDRVTLGAGESAFAFAGADLTLDGAGVVLRARSGGI